MKARKVQPKPLTILEKDSPRGLDGDSGGTDQYGTASSEIPEDPEVFRNSSLVDAPEEDYYA